MHTCGWLCVSSKYVCVYVGGFGTPGGHGVEGPAQELLIERDLRDMAGVSMLGHAVTGLWWAVKTSRRLRTINVCVCVHVCVHCYLYLLLEIRCVFMHVALRSWCVVEKMSIASLF